MARELRSLGGTAQGATRRGQDLAPVRLVDLGPGSGGATLDRPRWSYHALLPSDPRSASFARELVCHRLTEHDLQHLVHDVRLAASELATDAVLRTPRPFIMSLRGDDRLVLLSVRGSLRSASVQPRWRAPATRGRGLPIVDSLADDWGVRRGPGGGVWATFDVRGDDPSPPAGEARRLRLSV